MPFDFSTRRNISPTEQGGTSAVLIPTTIPPSIVSQTIYPSEGYDGFNEVTVPAVNYLIEPNITQGNIVRNVNILGVAGVAYENSREKYGVSLDNFLGDVDSNGVYHSVNSFDVYLNFSNVISVSDYSLQNTSSLFSLVQSFDFSNLMSTSNYAMSNSFMNNKLIEEALFPNLISIGNYSMINAFRNCTNLKRIDFKNVVNIGYVGMQNAFAGCTNLTEANFHSVITSRGTMLQNGFNGCRNLISANFCSINKIDYVYFGDAFVNCYNLQTVDFSGATVIGYESLTGAFRNCYNLVDVNMENIEKADSSVSRGFQRAFMNSGLRNLYLPKFTYAGDAVFLGVCYNCKNLQSFNFSSVINTASSEFQTAFYDCQNLNNGDFNAVRNANTSTFANCFYNCKSLTDFTFSHLSYINVGSFTNSFRSSGIQNLSFPSLTYAYTTSFTNMLRLVNDATVHFPFSMEESMINMPDVMNGFGGTNTTILFDLQSVSNNFGNYYNINESGTLGENTFAIASSVDNDNIYKALNQDISTGWSSIKSDNPHWITFYCPDSMYISEIKLVTNTGRYNRALPINVCTSNDNLLWNEQDIQYTNDINTQITINKPSYYKYYKLYFNSYNNNSSYSVILNTITLTGSYKY